MDIAEGLSKLFGGPKKTISNHYGVSDRDAAMMTGEMIGLMLSNNEKSKVLDTLFPKLGAKDRARVEMYHAARTILQKDMDNGR